MLAPDARVVAALHDVPQVFDDVVRHEQLAMLVVIEAPGVGGAFAEAFEDALRGVVAPDAAVDFGALVGRGAGGPISTSKMVPLQP